MKTRRILPWHDRTVRAIIGIVVVLIALLFFAIAQLFAKHFHSPSIASATSGLSQLTEFHSLSDAIVSDHDVLSEDLRYDTCIFENELFSMDEIGASTVAFDREVAAFVFPLASADSAHQIMDRCQDSLEYRGWCCISRNDICHTYYRAGENSLWLWAYCTMSGDSYTLTLMSPCDLSINQDKKGR